MLHTSHGAYAGAAIAGEISAGPKRATALRSGRLSAHLNAQRCPCLPRRVSSCRVARRCRPPARCTPRPRCQAQPTSDGHNTPTPNAGLSVVRVTTCDCKLQPAIACAPRYIATLKLHSSKDGTCCRQTVTEARTKYAQSTLGRIPAPTPSRSRTLLGLRSRAPRRQVRALPAPAHQVEVRVRPPLPLSRLARAWFPRPRSPPVGWPALAARLAAPPHAPSTQISWRS
jgi:hypothetical protein